MTADHCDPGSTVPSENPRLAPKDGGYALCRVEGCPRTTDDGQDEACGLVRLVGPEAADVPLCGASATIDAWTAAGLLDITPHISHAEHLSSYREGHV